MLPVIGNFLFYSPMWVLGVKHNNKKLNIKDIALDKILVKTLEVHKYFRVKGSP